ncbi:MAG: hypothetical protein ACPGWR_10115 [Ardenticatenaceae bacterium]
MRRFYQSRPPEQAGEAQVLPNQDEQAGEAKVLPVAAAEQAGEAQVLPTKEILRSAQEARRKFYQGEKSII